MTLYSQFFNMNKRIFLYIFFISVFNIGFAQTEKGRMILTANTDIKLLFGRSQPEHTHNDFDDVIKSRDYSFKTGAGYFIADNLSVGISASYNYNYTRQQIFLGTYPGDKGGIYRETLATSLGIIPSATYFFPVNGNLKPNLSVGAGYLITKGQEVSDNSSQNINKQYTGLSLNGSAGIAYFINRSVSFDLNLQYSRNRLNSKNADDHNLRQNLFGALAGISVYF